MIYQVNHIIIHIIHHFECGFLRQPHFVKQNIYFVDFFMCPCGFPINLEHYVNSLIVLTVFRHRLC